MNQLESRLRNLLRLNHSVIAKRPDTITNTHCLGEFLEFGDPATKIYLYRLKIVCRPPNRNEILLPDRA